MTARRVVTADDVLRAVANGGTRLVAAPGDRLTPLAQDLVRERGVRLVSGAAEPAGDRAEDANHPDGSIPRAVSSTAHSSATSRLPPLRHVSGAARLPLGPFPADLGRPQMDVRAQDVVTSLDGLPMTAGVMSMREGSFDWTLDYDEVQYILEGELHITRGHDRAVGLPGDVIAVPRGSSITFATPTWAKFLYVTYPAEWAGTS